LRRRGEEDVKTHTHQLLNDKTADASAAAYLLVKKKKKRRGEWRVERGVASFI
jgi:hypothetical protein